MMLSWLKSWFYRCRFGCDTIQVDRVGWHHWDGEKWISDLIKIDGVRNVRASDPVGPSLPFPLGLHIREGLGQVSALPVKELQTGESDWVEQSDPPLPSPDDAGAE